MIFVLHIYIPPTTSQSDITISTTESNPNISQLSSYVREALTNQKLTSGLFILVPTSSTITVNDVNEAINDFHAGNSFRYSHYQGSFSKIGNAIHSNMTPTTVANWYVAVIENDDHLPLQAPITFSISPLCSTDESLIRRTVEDTFNNLIKHNNNYPKGNFKIYPQSLFESDNSTFQIKAGTTQKKCIHRPILPPFLSGKIRENGRVTYNLNH